MSQSVCFQSRGCTLVPITRFGFLLGLSVGLVSFSLHAEEAVPDKTNSRGLFTYDHEGTEREYLIHRPKDLPKKAPLVVFLHGYRGDARRYAKMGMSRVADENQFAVVYPQGLKDRRDITHWNARMRLSNVDDIGFLVALIDHLQKKYDLDPDRTFVSGVSNGGFMSYTMVSEHPDRFRAAASIIGTVSGESWRRRDQMKPVPILQISGLSDNIVPVDGSMTRLGGWGGAPDQKTIIKFFRELNQTKREEVEKLSSRATAYRYLDGVNGNEVWLYEVEDWGHRVPRASELGVHSVDLVWDFFSRY